MARARCGPSADHQRPRGRLEAGKPKPVWTELMQYLDDSPEITKIVSTIYPPGQQ